MLINLVLGAVMVYLILVLVMMFLGQLLGNVYVSREMEKWDQEIYRRMKDE